ncbi:MAG: cupin domain-containing protein [Isosphaeraceae bacterium]
MQTGVSRAGEGRSVWVVGDRCTIKTSGRDTGGAYAMIEITISPGGGPPPHVHHNEDEAFYLLEGRVEFHADGASFTADPGSWITLPRLSLHHYCNIGETDARMLVVVNPAGLDDFFLEAGQPVREGETAHPPTPEEIQRVVELAPRYGLDNRVPTN